MQPFASDIKKIRDRARQHISEGAVTGAYKADRAQVIKVLNEALATEIVCVLRYKRHYFMASGINSDSVKEEFLQHAAEEQGHADSICTRIVQLNGEPNLNPEGLTTRSRCSGSTRFPVCELAAGRIRSRSCRCVAQPRW